MSWSLVFTDVALVSLKKIPKSDQRRVITKLEWFSKQELPGIWLKRLVDFDYAEYRARVGDYRVLCSLNVSTETLTVLLVAHRREVYEG